MLKCRPIKLLLFILLFFCVLNYQFSEEYTFNMNSVMNGNIVTTKAKNYLCAQ